MAKKKQRKPKGKVLTRYEATCYSCKWCYTTKQHQKEGTFRCKYLHQTNYARDDNPCIFYQFDYWWFDKIGHCDEKDQPWNGDREEQEEEFKKGFNKEVTTSHAKKTIETSKPPELEKRSKNEQTKP